MDTKNLDQSQVKTPQEKENEKFAAEIKDMDTDALTELFESISKKLEEFGSADGKYNLLIEPKQAGLYRSLIVRLQNHFKRGRIITPLSMMPHVININVWFGEQLDEKLEFAKIDVVLMQTWKELIKYASGYSFPDMYRDIMSFYEFLNPAVAMYETEHREAIKLDSQKAIVLTELENRKVTNKSKKVAGKSIKMEVKK